MTNYDPTLDTTTIHLGLWSAALYHLGGDYYEENTEGMYAGQLRAACALVHLSSHEHIEEDDVKIRAALLAAREWRGNVMIAPADVLTMADNFAAYYNDWDVVLDEHLRKNYNDFPLAYITSEAREKLKGDVKRDSEIWVESDKFTGIYVYNRPSAR